MMGNLTDLRNDVGERLRIREEEAACLEVCLA